VDVDTIIIIIIIIYFFVGGGGIFRLVYYDAKIFIHE